MWDDLPIEISNDILHRLPVKTLIRCTVLSKSFLSLITSQPFISDHITQHADSHLLLRYFTHDRQEKYHFESDDHNFSGFQTDGLLVPFYNYIEDCFTVAGCVNGVICLVNDFTAEGTLIILWNPSIRKFVNVPQPIIIFQTCDPYESVCGFGFDPVSDDYKVVRLVVLDADFEARSKTQVEVYSLKSGCWRVIGVGPCYSIKRYEGYTPRYTNGSVYWVASCYSPNYENVLLRFDMSTEIFETLQLPEVLKWSESRCTRDLHVQASERILTLIKRNFNAESRTCSTCSAWILKEDGVVKSWTKIFDFDISKLRPHGMPMTFSFTKNGEVIMVKSDIDSYWRVENVVVSIDPITKSGTTLREVNAESRSFYLSSYVESMVLFKEGKGIEEQNTPLNFFPMKRNSVYYLVDISVDRDVQILYRNWSNLTQFSLCHLETQCFASPIRKLPKPEVPEIPNPEVSELPKPTVSELPKPEIPAVTTRRLLDAPELPKPEVPELPKIAVPEFPKPEMPDLPKITLPELPKPELPELPKIAEPELPKPKMPEVPELPKPEVPELTKPEIPELPKPELPNLPKPEVHELPKPVVPELPKPQVPDVPKPEVPELPKLKVPEVPEPEVPELPKSSLPELPKPEVHELPKPVVPELPKPEVPEVPKPEVPELPKPEVPELPKPAVPELPKPEVPELPKPEIPQLPKPVVPEHPAKP